MTESQPVYACNLITAQPAGDRKTLDMTENARLKRRRPQEKTSNPPACHLDPLHQTAALLALDLYQVLVAPAPAPDAVVPRRVRARPVPVLGRRTLARCRRRR